MNALTQKKCVPCEGQGAPLTRDDFALYLEQVKEWQVIDDVQLLREFRFDSFKKAMEFVNKVAKIAEKENHHPDIYIYEWRKVRLSLTTHALSGLSLNDFILASKIDLIEI
jgi:4a-hydroxytetrahydrobiopterin dehydratase